ncbi:MAG TPA: hypothetical protein VGG39_04250 [Polyangiaceae bacterium]
MKSAAEWKAFYAGERAALGEVGLRERLDAAPSVDLPAGGALVFPHTMMARTGDLTAAAARAVVRSGAEEVLALGVLHGGRDADGDRVRRARAGDANERAALRRVHDGEAALCAEEFSLDNFVVMLRAAASAEGKRPPRVVARYPFLVGNDVDLPGMDDLHALAARMPVVATTDPLHHGAGYGTPEGKRLREGDDATVAWARTCIDRQLALLAAGDWPAFATLATDIRSDFRDAGPALFAVLGKKSPLRGAILDLRLVDYAEVLGAESPSWVAGPLMRISPG